MKHLALENSRLKNIIAKKALEIEFKDELLKKAVKLKRCHNLYNVLLKQGKGKSVVRVM